jgi:hypothetical protein
MNEQRRLSKWKRRTGGLKQWWPISHPICTCSGRCCQGSFKACPEKRAVYYPVDSFRMDWHRACKVLLSAPFKPWASCFNKGQI